MSRTVLYYFAPQSPWSYLGHARLVDLLARSRREVAVLPVDSGRIFPQSGGLPLAKRAPQRQAYRLVDAATGEFEAGWVAVADMVTRQPWDDDLPVHVTSGR